MYVSCVVDFHHGIPKCVRTKGRPRGLFLGEALMHFLAASSARDDVYSSLRINIGTVTLASVEGIGSLITMFVAIDPKVYTILKEAEKWDRKVKVSIVKKRNW